LLKLWREARRRLGDPVAAWAEITAWCAHGGC
jgi:nitrate reductase alpha subunit